MADGTTPEARSAEDKQGLCHGAMGPRRLFVQRPLPVWCRSVCLATALLSGLLGQEGTDAGVVGSGTQGNLYFSSSVSRPLECVSSGKAGAAFSPLCPRGRGRTLRGRQTATELEGLNRRRGTRGQWFSIFTAVSSGE